MIEIYYIFSDMENYEDWVFVQQDEVTLSNQQDEVTLYVQQNEVTLSVQQNEVTLSVRQNEVTLSVQQDEMTWSNPDEYEDILTPNDLVARSLLHQRLDSSLYDALAIVHPEVPSSPFVSGYTCNCGRQTCISAYCKFVEQFREEKKSGRVLGQIQRPSVWVCGVNQYDDLMLLPSAAAIVTCVTWSLLTKIFSLEPQLKMFLVTMFNMTLYGYCIACSTGRFPNIIGITLPFFEISCEKHAHRFVTLETKMKKMLKHPIWDSISLVTEKMHEHIMALVFCESETITPDLNAVVSFCFLVLSLPDRIIKSRITQEDTLISILQTIKQISHNYSVEDNGGENLLKACGYHTFESPCGHETIINTEDQEY